MSASGSAPDGSPAAAVTVVGAGIAGIACAVALEAAAIPVRVIDRGRAPGGRLSAPTLHGRRVDLGAAYFTVTDDTFAAVVERWRAGSIARPWTDTFDAWSDRGHDTKRGPMRWAAADGLRSLVRELIGGAALDIESGSAIDSLDELSGTVVLAMPDPQAARLVPGGIGGIGWIDYEPVISVAASWRERCWPMAAAGFVNDDPDLALVADDGARRGDGAPVLVLHSTSQLARRHLADPGAAIGPLLQALQRTVGVGPAPEWTHAHRWSFAKPTAAHEQPFALGPAGDRLTLAACGDSWCPSGSPRVESAWLSGHRLGLALVTRLG